MTHLALALLLFGLALPAAADQIDSFSPQEVTVGTALTIHGDFSDILASGKAPRVTGTRLDFAKGIAFEVVEVTSSDLEVVATKFPKSKTESLAGKAWSLVVTPPKGAGDPLTAGDTFTTIAPDLVDVSTDSAEPGEVVELLVDDLGSGKVTVLFGDKKAKPTDPPLLTSTLVTAAAPSSLFVIVPKLPGGSYPISILNAIGPSPAPIVFTVIVPVNVGSCPSLVATLTGASNYDSDVYYNTSGIPGIHSCEGNATCSRVIDATFDPSPALNNPGQGFVANATINYFESQGGMLPDLQWAGMSQVSFAADSASGPVRGSFSGTLLPVDPNPNANVGISALFCAEQNPVVP